MMWGTLAWFWLWRNTRYLPCSLPWSCKSKFFVRDVGPLRGNQVSKIILARGCQSKSLAGGKDGLCPSERRSKPVPAIGWACYPVPQSAGTSTSEGEYGASVWWCLCTAFSSGTSGQRHLSSLIYTALVAPAQKTICCQINSFGYPGFGCGHAVCQSGLSR